MSFQCPGCITSNAIAAIALCDQLGIDFDVVRTGLARFSGPTADARCWHTPDVTLVDDYAHHPAEIRATWLRCGRRQEVGGCVPAPTFLRTRLLHDEFVRSFSLADVIAVTEIY